MLVVSLQSTEFVRVPVAATLSGASVNVSLDTVQMAFVTPGTSPGSGDWKNASWETDSTTNPPTYYARALVGPTGGAVQLAAGVWDVFVKVTDNPEVPARRAGPIEIV